MSKLTVEIGKKMKRNKEHHYINMSVDQAGTTWKIYVSNIITPHYIKRMLRYFKRV